MQGAALWKIAFAILAIAVVAGLVILIAAPGKETEIIITPGGNERILRFGVFGAVKEPGYYSSDAALRIADAAGMAGGLAENADPARANLAKWIDDGETVFIPTVNPSEPTLTPVPPDDEKIDLNSADAEELMKLPGIGKKRAEDIIKLRDQKGRFDAPEDILTIPGISEKLLESIYDRLIIK